MTDRLKGFIVILDADIREDDAEPILDAIRMIKHVLKVTPLVTEFSDMMARELARDEFRDKLWKVLYPDRK